MGKQDSQVPGVQLDPRGPRDPWDRPGYEDLVVPRVPKDHRAHKARKVTPEYQETRYLSVCIDLLIAAV